MFFSYYSILGTADCNTDGKCWVEFRGGDKKVEKVGQSIYNILYTDYDNVVFIYNCEKSVFGKEEDGWIMTRDWNITKAQLDAYEAHFKQLVPDFGGRLQRHK